MKSLLVFAISAFIGLMGTISSASADIITLTYTGSVSGDVTNQNKIDGLDLFGGGKLNGDKFTLVYVFNTSTGSYIAGTTSSTYSGTTGTVTLTINGKSVTLTGNDDSTDDASHSGVFSSTSQTIETNGPDNMKITESVFTTSSPGIPGSIDAPYTFNGSSTGLFTIYGSGDRKSQVILDATKVVETIGPVSGVPEPATWAMMLIGFGLVGVKLHRRAASRVA